VQPAGITGPYPPVQPPCKHGLTDDAP